MAGGSRVQPSIDFLLHFDIEFRRRRLSFLMWGLNLLYSRLPAGDENAKIHPAIAPLAEKSSSPKHRVSAFAGTDLDLMLRANGIETLILTGSHQRRRTH